MDNFYVDIYKRVWGNKAIEETTIITNSNNEMVISSEDNEYIITVAPGTYKSLYVTGYSELVDAIKANIASNSYPVNVLFGGNHKDVKYNSLVFGLTNDKEIVEMSGLFFDNFFDSV